DLLLQTCDQFGLQITPRLSLFPQDPDGKFTVASLLRNRMILGGTLIPAEESTALADEVRAAVDATPPFPSETMPAWTARAGLTHRARDAVLAESGFAPTGPPWRVQMHLSHPPVIGKLCWMLADGTDSIAHALATDLDIRLERPVRLIAEAARRVTVE